MAVEKDVELDSVRDSLLPVVLEGNYGYKLISHAWLLKGEDEGNFSLLGAWKNSPTSHNPAFFAYSSQGTATIEQIVSQSHAASTYERTFGLMILSRKINRGNSCCGYHSLAL